MLKSVLSQQCKRCAQLRHRWSGVAQAPAVRGGGGANAKRRLTTSRAYRVSPPSTALSRRQQRPFASEVGGGAGASGARSGLSRSPGGVKGTDSVAASAPFSGGSRPVATWLFGTAAAVGVMVTVGGVTRLTKSGLAMTDWKLQGSLPPTTREEWEAEFERYKQFPEWNQRRSMTLEEFQSIYWWEYGHRMLGRGLGLVYGLPLAYFALRGMIPSHIKGKVWLLLGLGGTQGLIGWWMVKSGLEMDPEQRKEIRVSPYRLATHLGMAFTTFSLLVHTGLEALKGKLPPPDLSSASINPELLLRRATQTRSLAVGVAGLAFVTALSGAFVAGNDAGRAYNVFPKMMEDRWLPEEILEMKPMWRNFFENTATVQADHRVLALSTYASILSLFAFATKSAGGHLWAALPLASRRALGFTLGISTAQVGLGISTLLMHVPIPLAAAHQAGALALLGTTVWASHSLRFAAAGAAARRMGTTAAAAALK